MTYGRPPSHARCVEAIEEINRRLTALDLAHAADAGPQLEAELLRVQFDYWDGWRRILEDQRP